MSVRQSPEVRALFERLCGGAPPMAGVVHFRQRGELRAALDGPWRPFRARQTISTQTCAFDWRASTGPLGVVSARERYAVGVAGLQVKALGLLSRVSPPPSIELNRGGLIRYLAEIAWAPDAILANPALTWATEGSRRLKVSAGDGLSATAVEFQLDDDGRLAVSFAPLRPRMVNKYLMPTPWRGQFDDYRLVEGRWIPHRGEVGWILDGVYRPYWRGEIADWRLIAG